MSKEPFHPAPSGSEPHSSPPAGLRDAEGRGGDDAKQVEKTNANKKVLVIMGATGAGKSRLGIDLAEHFTGVEIINADSMQVYRGLDILTNKVPISERKGVPHHLLGTFEESMEFTSRDFRDAAIPIIDDILSRGCLPVIVGGTNYYIQALVSPFLVDDVVEDMGECFKNSLFCDIDLNSISSSSSYELLKEIDLIAASRIHPNDHRKINRYVSVYAGSGVLPSSLFHGNHAEKWGRAENFRYTCCFFWLDASLSALDRYINSRVDSMINAGLLNEVSDIYKPSSDYTRGLKQAIGVREFEEFFRAYSRRNNAFYASSLNGNIDVPKPKFADILHSKENELQILLFEAIEKFKANTRKLVRRQKRRLNRLKADFGWNMKYIDVTKALSDEAGDSWSALVLQPCVENVRAFLLGAGSFTSNEESHDMLWQRLTARELCTQYVCEACGNRVLRGKHEWEQHTKGRVHRKRFLSFKKHLKSSLDQEADNYGELKIIDLSPPKPSD
ncbi:tRNA dimethylallyltransferase 2 [Phalaenopsis equestris]|uniref:tRNA dimethylallyltransferase 2 n=1 Tax=Phalaenopsis equestris TaxID=78828 RepID=UPI0009E3C077|nr:tRNA dimethylallyltransferase 2 [Phalaenopsis equestris]